MTTQKLKQQTAPRPRSVSRPKVAMERLGVKPSKFFADFVVRPGAGEFVPGTRARRLHLLHLGPRTSGIVDEEIDALIDALIAEAHERAQIFLGASPDPKPEGEPEPEKFFRGGPA